MNLDHHRPFPAPALLAALLAALTTVGCSSTRYGDPNEEETLNVDWGSTDLQTFSQRMADSLLDAPGMSFLLNAAKGDDQRIIAVMGRIGNETHEHINTEDLVRHIQTALVESGKFRFVAAGQGQGEIDQQIRFQQSGKVDPALAKEYGKQLGAEVVIYGTLSDIRKTTGRSVESLGTKETDVYYSFVLDCVNVETAEIVWSNKEEIRKQQVVGLFGKR